MTEHLNLSEIAAETGFTGFSEASTRELAAANEALMSPPQMPPCERPTIVVLDPSSGARLPGLTDGIPPRLLTAMIFKAVAEE